MIRSIFLSESITVSPCPHPPNHVYNTDAASKLTVGSVDLYGLIRLDLFMHLQSV